MSSFQQFSVPARQVDSDDDSDSNLDDVPLTMPDSDEDGRSSQNSPTPHALTAAMPHLRLSERTLTKEATFSMPFQTPTSGFHNNDYEPVPTPRGGPAGPHLALALERQGSAPRAGLKPPRLTLPSTAGASPAASPTVSANFLDLPAPSHSPTAHHQQKHRIQLISQAFILNRAALQKAAEQGLGVREVIERRCMTGLGVSAEELQFYELRHISSNDISEFCNIGVEVNGNSFSLSALEDVMSDRGKLMMMNEKNSVTLENLHNDYREARHEIARLQLKAVEHEADSKRWQQRYKLLEHENEQLRHKLAASDEARVQAFNTVTELRREFDIMKASYERDRLSNSQGAHVALRSSSTTAALLEGVPRTALSQRPINTAPVPCAQQSYRDQRPLLPERISIDTTATRADELGAKAGSAEH